MDYSIRKITYFVEMVVLNTAENLDRLVRFCFFSDAHLLGSLYLVENDLLVSDSLELVKFTELLKPVELDMTNSSLQKT